MKASEFKRWLTKQGAVITPGKGSHHKVTLNNLRSTFAIHPSKEMGSGMVNKIKKDLGIK